MSISMRRGRALFGLVLVVGAIASWWYYSPRDTGDVLAALPPSTATWTPSRVITPTTVGVSVVESAPASVLTPVGGEVTATDPRPAPSRIRIPALGVDASVVALGIDGSGLMEVPSDVDTVGWYRYGPVPGDPGSAVMAAHIDSARQGPGVFFRLGTLHEGDIIEVTDAAGEVARFVVRAVELIDKDELPLDRVFARAGGPVLTLITCGGSFSRADRSYDSNTVVVAVPVGPAGIGGGGAR